MKLHSFLLLSFFSATANAASYLATKLENASPSSESSAVVAPASKNAHGSPASPPPGSPASTPPAPDKANQPRTFNEWQRKAMEAFPELKDPDSVFNHAFIQRVNKIKQTNPDFLDDPKWPFLLAQQINNSDMALIPGLNLKPVEPAIKIEPYDELDKANVRLDCVRENMSSISSKAHCREIELSVFQIQSEKALVSVEAIFVHGGAGKETLVSAGSKKLEAGVGTVSFSSDEGNSAQPSKPNNDQKVVGWLARAIAEDGRILGVAASSEKYLLIAKKP